MPITTTRLLRFSRQFERYYAQQFAPLMERTGLSLGEIRVLLFLANNPGLDTARDMTEFRGLGKSQVSQAVERLAARGLLRRTADAADRRVVHLAATPAGAPLVREAQAIQAACVALMFSGLTGGEREQFFELLEKVLDKAERYMEGATDA